ncbi:unnamed protein product, partial [marine sediment metagenome]
DEYKTAQRKIKVKDMTSLDEYPELILYEGWYCNDPPKVHLTEGQDK